MRRIRTEDDLLDMSRQASALAIIAGWAKLGLFDALADGKARKLDELPANPRSLRITAPILMHVGILVGDGERFALSHNARKLHEAGALGAFRALDTFDDLSRIDEVLSRGGPARDRDGESKATDGGVHEEDVPRARAFMKMLYRRSEASAKETAAWSQRYLPRGGHILDVGGGHGRYGRELVEIGYQATIIDKQVCIDLARELHGERLSYIARDFMKEDIGGPYDGALLSNIVHGLSESENRALVQKLAKALKPGGFIVFKDMFIDDLGAHPENAVLFGLTMLLYTEGGESFTVGDVDDWCKDAGLLEVESVTLDDFTLLFAKKGA